MSYPYYPQQAYYPQQQQQYPNNAYASYAQQQVPAMWSNNTPYSRTNALPMQNQAPVIPATPAPLNNISRPERSSTLPANYPLRSALKRSRKLSKPTEKSEEPFHYVPGPRKRTTSIPQAVDLQTPPGHTEPSMQCRLRSLPILTDFFPKVQWFVSLHNTNELHLGQLSVSAIKAIRESILPIWPQGHDVDELDGEVWRVRFRGTPWTFSGPDAHK